MTRGTASRTSDAARQTGQDGTSSRTATPPFPERATRRDMPAEPASGHTVAALFPDAARRGAAAHGGRSLSSTSTPPQRQPSRHQLAHGRAAVPRTSDATRHAD